MSTEKHDHDHDDDQPADKRMEALAAAFWNLFNGAAALTSVFLLIGSVTGIVHPDAPLWFAMGLVSLIVSLLLLRLFLAGRGGGPRAD